MISAGDESPGIAALETSSFDFALPPELIAQTPLPNRDASRLLVIERVSGSIHHSKIAALGEWLQAGDLLVVNNSRVMPARLRGWRLPNRGAVEILLLRRSGRSWNALARPAKRLRPGMKLEFPALEADGEPAIAVVERRLDAGEVELHFEDAADDRLDLYGMAPLPPYITKQLTDAERYQTLFAQEPGSAAAPTAGLHFSEALLQHLDEVGIERAEITLHVGLDTFRPVNEALVKDHHIHREWCRVSLEAAHQIAACRRRGNRVVAIGTTAARTLETIGRTWSDEHPAPFEGYTEEFIVPGHRWRLVDALLTNFHLPRSTLLMLVSAFAGREVILKSYHEAMKRGYRFYSFGDAMLIR